MISKTKKRIALFVAYPAFFSTAFLGMFFWLFPYDALKEWLQSEARQNDIELTVASLGPALFGIEARDLQLHLFKPAEGKRETTPLRIDSLKLFPHVFPMGAHIQAKLLGGHLDAAFQAGQSKKFKLRADQLQLAQVPPEALGSLVLDGALALLADVTFDEQDFAKMQGRVALLGTQMLLSKGTVQGFTLPRVDLGRIELEFDLSEGKARLGTARSTGVDFVMALEGEIRQARKVSLSTPNLSLRFQPSEDFLKRNTLVSAALGLAAQKDSEGFYEASIKGTLGTPKFTPQKNSRRR